MADIATAPRKRLIINGEIRPLLPRYVRLHRDRVRERWVLLAPERVVEIDQIAVAVLDLCDGARTLAEIADALAGDYDASPADIRADIAPMLQDLADKGYIRDNRAGHAK